MFDFLQDLDNDISDALLIQLRNLWTQKAWVSGLHSWQRTAKTD